MYEYPSSYQQGDFTDPVVPHPRVILSRVSAERSSSGGNRGITLNTQPCAILSLVVRSGAGLSSVSRDRSGVHAPVAWNDGARFCFAPLAGRIAPAMPPPETVNICWQLQNPALIQQAVLELYVRNNNNPVWTQNMEWRGNTLRPATDPPANPVSPRLALDQLPWAGDFVPEVAVAQDFPTGCVNAAQSPYKLKMTIVPLGGSPAGNLEAWTYFDVRVERIELGWFPQAEYPKVLPPSTSARDADVYQKLLDATDANNLNGAFPAPAGNAKRVYLKGNIFYKASPELEDNTFYTRWQAAWDDGPNVPVLATIYLRDSTGAAVLAPWAVGAIRLFWDWVDKARDWGNVAEDPTVPSNDANILSFLNDSQNYLTAATLDSPVGQNCHVDRGGKRGLNAEPVFPNQNGIAPIAILPPPLVGAADNAVFPFAVTNNTGAAARKWSAFSSAWPDGQFMGQSGILFQPSRMPGDGYELHAFPVAGTDPYVIANADSAENPLSSFHAKSGIFRVWRWVDLSAYLRAGTNALPGAPDAFPLPVIRDSLKGGYAFLNTAGVVPANVTANFRLQLANVVSGAVGNAEDYVRYAVDMSGTHPGLIEFHPRDVWLNNLLMNKFLGDLDTMRTWLNGNVGRLDANGHEILQYWNSGNTHPAVLPWPVVFTRTAVHARDHRVSLAISAQTAAAFPGAAVAPVGAPLVLNLDVNFASDTANPVAAGLNAMDPLIDQIYNHVFANAQQGGGQLLAFNFRGPNDPRVMVTMTAKTPADLRDKRGRRIQIVEQAFRDKWDAKVADRSTNLYRLSTGRAWVFTLLDNVIDQLAPNPGITILHLDHLSTRTETCNLPTGKAMFANAAGDVIRPMVLADAPVLPTMIHEIGHCLFLNHTFHSARTHDRMEFSQYPPPAHGAVMHVTPSMASATASIEGFDMLRMRGWSMYKTDNAGLPLPVPPGLQVVPGEPRPLTAWWRSRAMARDARM